MKLIPVEGSPSLARDAITGAIVNINTSEIQQARARKQLMKQKDHEVNLLRSEFAQLKDDVSDIKQLLSKIAEKL